LDQYFWKFRYRIKWNEDFRKTHFENFGQPLEAVLFPGNLEIPEMFCCIGHSILNLGQTIGPSPSCDCQMEDGGVKSLFITVASVFSSDDLPFFLWHLNVEDNGNVTSPDAPIGKSKTIRNDCNNKLKCTHFFAHDRKNCLQFGYLENLAVSI